MWFAEHVERDLIVRIQRKRGIGEYIYMNHHTLNGIGGLQLVCLRDVLGLGGREGNNLQPFRRPYHYPEIVNYGRAGCGFEISWIAGIT